MTSMLAPEFTLHDDFPPVSYDEWRVLAEADLDGRLDRTQIGIVGSEPAYRAGAAPLDELPLEHEQRVVRHGNACLRGGAAQRRRGLVDPLDRLGHAQLAQPGEDGRHVVRGHRRDEAEPGPRVVGPAASGDEDRERPALLDVGARTGHLVVVGLQPGQQVAHRAIVDRGGRLVA